MAFVTGEGLPVVGTVTEVGSGWGGHRATPMKALRDRPVAVVAVAGRDRWTRFGAEHAESAPAAQGRRALGVDPGETPG